MTKKKVNGEILVRLADIPRSFWPKEFLFFPSLYGNQKIAIVAQKQKKLKSDAENE